MLSLVTPLLILCLLIYGGAAEEKGESPQITNPNNLDYSLQYYKCETYGHHCIDATQCRPIMKLLQGSDANVSRAQFMYCGEEHDEQYKDFDNQYGFGPIDSAIGPPLACCAKDEIITFPFVSQICNPKITQLRDHRCGMTSVFYLNLDTKNFLMEEYRYRLAQIKRNPGKPCVRAALDFTYRGKRCADRGNGTDDGVDKEIGHRVELGDLVYQKRMQMKKDRIPVKKQRSRSKKTSRRKLRNADFINTRTEEHKRHKRFIGGLRARIGQFPFLAVVYFKEYKTLKSYFGCLGTIIHPELVLSAYTCINRGLIQDIWSGGYQYRNDSKDGVPRQFVNGMVYPLTYEPQKVPYHFAANYDLDYDKKGKEFTKKYNGTWLHPYGLTIIKVQYPFEFDDFTQPICIPTEPYKESWFDGPRVSVGLGFGAGLVNESQGFPHYAYLEKTDDCENLLFRYYKQHFPMKDPKNKPIWDCVKPDRGTQPCMFDEGSPLLRMTKDGFMMQTGILMRMPQESCGYINMPIVYLDLNRFTDWLPIALRFLFTVPAPPFSRYAPGTIAFSPYNSNSPTNCLSEYELKKWDGYVINRENN